LLVQAVAFNLALLIRTKYGMGKPRSAQGAMNPVVCLQFLCAALGVREESVINPDPSNPRTEGNAFSSISTYRRCLTSRNRRFHSATGC
ncbi:MAG: hypothetical protein SFV54_00275, partial [Bryobacteraceae bacterium]|nr:hypothetical protein [Bryobacteraceae bacterium]